MNDQMYLGEIIDADYVEITPTPYSMSAGLLPQRTSTTIKKTIQKALATETHDRCLACLAKIGMEHTAMLSMMEQQFSSMTPQSAARYREIVDAYARQAADKIRRW